MKLTKQEQLIIKKHPMNGGKEDLTIPYDQRELKGMYEKIYGSSRVYSPRKGKGSFVRKKVKRRIRSHEIAE